MFDPPRTTRPARSVRFAPLLVAAATALLGACASTPPPPQAASRGYSPAAIQRIMALREGGESLANVAREVGGTRRDVRAVERRELALRRQ
jgi:hypothetical protein